MRGINPSYTQTDWSTTFESGSYTEIFAGSSILLTKLVTRFLPTEITTVNT